MPLYWTIILRERLVTGIADGGVRKDEMEAYLDAIAGAGAGDYRELFDGSIGEPLMDLDDIMSIAVRMRGMQQLGLAGPLAIVMPRGSTIRSPACSASCRPRPPDAVLHQRRGRARLAGRA